jgi:predicted  nucleic acid-binding Zn-ribbon protein
MQAQASADPKLMKALRQAADSATAELTAANERVHHLETRLNDCSCGIDDAANRTWQAKYEQLLLQLQGYMHSSTAKETQLSTEVQSLKRKLAASDAYLKAVQADLKAACASTGDAALVQQIEAMKAVVARQATALQVLV